MPPIPRELAPADVPSLLEVAAACEQTGVQSVTDEPYRTYLLTTGRLLVSGEPGAVRGYAGLVERGGAAYLTDLFVHPDARDQGHGRALLAAMWDRRTERVTSSSQDPRALSGYARYGARPRWPLLYLSLPGRSGDSIETRSYADGDAGWPVPTEGLVTASTDDGSCTAVVHRVGDRMRVLRAVTRDPTTLPALVDGLAGLVGPTGSVGVCVPGPHPALPALLASGARIRDLDLWCATDGAVDVVDPTRELPSPALA
ncbi:MAG: GNAT family N-acetyltransferase [Candidatus Nanopelagicales bacterium]